MNHEYDVAVVGGGPGGYVAAIRAAQEGLKAVLFEGEALGGTCLNWGCIPTKALLHSTELLHEMRGAGALGIDLGGVSPKPDLEALEGYKSKAVKRLTGGVRSLLKGAGVEVVMGRAKLEAPHTLLTEEGKRFTCANMILAMGSEVAVPPIPGLDQSGYWTSRTILSGKLSVPPRLLIIGGGVIGVEFANIFSDLGSKVTVVEMLDQLLPRMDGDVAGTLAKEFKKRGIDVRTGVQVTKVVSNGSKAVTIREGEEESFLEAEEILVAVGRKPRLDTEGLEALGIRTNGKGIVVDETQRTSVPNIYAIGDVTGRWQLAHAASADGIAAVDHILGKKNYSNREIVPSCVYTRPEIAAVGMTTPEAQEAGYAVVEGTFPMAANSKSSIVGATAGMVKLVSDEKTGALLGAHIIGERATDLVSEVALAMSAEVTVEEIGAAIHPHPTVSEAVMEATHDLEGLAIHKPATRRS